MRAVSRPTISRRAREHPADQDAKEHRPVVCRVRLGGGKPAYSREANLAQ